ncbi:hypothetical protein DM860_007744 [Cuscuta australis]|uniref:Uncharacterized protein n=1 Tax=Cuscuta australis TaxID=267555 RepID=A0A328E6A3_9ASTE|nr:hypothetical protein DM860_007744 [Cuscuta australis]
MAATVGRLERRGPIFALVILLALICTRIRADVGADTNVDFVRSDCQDFSTELESLKSKILTLESYVEEKVQELSAKDLVIAERDNIIKVKSDRIASLQSEISSLQKKGSLDAREQVGKAQARADLLEKQAESIRNEIELKNEKNKELEAQRILAEKQLTESNSKIMKLQKTIEEQKAKLQKTERALQVAEEEMMRARFDATIKAKELVKIQGAWLPSWLAVHLKNYQAIWEKHWQEHVKPAMNVMLEKALETKAQTEAWAAPHVETIKSKWVPPVKEQMLLFIAYVEPHLHTLKAKTFEMYATSKNSVMPHVLKVQEIADPYFQEIRKFSKPYIDQVATTTRPHVEKARLAVKPYTKKAIHAYGKFLKSATTYHNQVQGTVQETLKRHELTKSLATKEFTWFAASAVLAFPILVLFKVFSAIFGAKVKPSNRSGVSSNHSRRRAKRSGQHHPSREK